MSRLWARLSGMFSNRKLVGVDKAGNKYLTRTEEIDGVIKEKRWVVFKGEEEPTSISVEWICWLNGQRKRAPTPEEMAELEARRERLRLNVALLKEEEGRRASEGATRKAGSTDKVTGPDLKSFIQQFPATSDGEKTEDMADTMGALGNSRAASSEKRASSQVRQMPHESSEPTGSGESFRPGTWQPPT